MGNIITTGVVWFLVGLLLLLGELVMPGLVLIFFGLGAWVTALCCLFFDIGLNVQLVIFLVSSLVSLALLRKAIREKYTNFRQGPSAELESDYIGHTVTALEDFGANTPGKVSFRGTNWEAVSSVPVIKGQTLVITGFKSIRLIVEPLKTEPS